MKRIWLSSAAALLSGLGVCHAQAPAPLPPPAPGFQLVDPDRMISYGTGSAVGSTYGTGAGGAVPPGPYAPVHDDLLGGGCGANGCGSAGCPTPAWGPVGRAWFRAEYLAWWVKAQDAPPLVGFAPPQFAATGDFPPGSIQSLAGGPDHPLSYGEQDGYRFEGGVWLDANQEWGVDASYFRLQNGSFTNTYRSTGDPLLGPLFFDPQADRITIIEFADPTGRAGTMLVSGSNRLWGAEGNVIKRACSIFSTRTDVLVGFRYLQFDENLLVAGSSVPPDGSDGIVAATLDTANTRNRFYGPQVGWTSDFQYKRWFVTMTGKAALGDMHQEATISGAALLNVPGEPLHVFGNGVLAQLTNIGHYSRDQVAFVPEFTLNTGFQVAPYCRLSIGYNVLWASSVARPGSELDFVVNATQVPVLGTFNATTPAPHPGFVWHGTSMWAQGLNLGVELRY